MPDIYSTKKPSKKVSDNITNKLKICGPGAGTRSAIKIKELDIENSYDNIKYLESKLLDNTLTYDEYSKIIDNIDQINKNIPKKEKRIR